MHQGAERREEAEAAGPSQKQGSRRGLGDMQPRASTFPQTVGQEGIWTREPAPKDVRDTLVPAHSGPVGAGTDVSSTLRKKLNQRKDKPPYKGAENRGGAASDLDMTQLKDEQHRRNVETILKNLQSLPIGKGALELPPEPSSTTSAQGMQGEEPLGRLRGKA